MKNSKTIALIIMLLLCLVVALSSCGGNTEEKTYDAAFLKDLSKGLMNRWDLAMEDGETQEDYYERLVTAELNKIGDYTTKKFEDTELQEKAISYINLLKNQQEALKYASSDYTKYFDMWESAYQKRTQAVREFIDTYDLTFPNKYSDVLSEFDKVATVADENDKLKEDIQTMLDNLTFEKVKESGSYKYYEALIENISDQTFESFSIDINLIDTDGVILDTEYVYVNNFAPGRKAKLEFSTDKDFVSLEYTASYY